MRGSGSALLALVALLSAADGARRADAGPSTDRGYSDADRLSLEGAAALRGLVEAGVQRDLLWRDFGDCRDGVRRFYEARGFRLAWIGRSGATPQARAIVGALRSSDERGLDPEDYDGPRWPERLHALGRSTQPPSESDRVRLDVALTVSALRYVSDMRDGRIDPRRLGMALAQAGRRATDPSEVLRDLANADDVQRALGDLEPPFAAYRRTVQALQRYRQLAAEDGVETFPLPPRPVEPGERYSAAPRLAAFLLRVGDLRSVDDMERDETIYGAALAWAVRRFQARHGVEPDGRLGPRTLKALNTPLSQRVTQLQLTLERWRWAPRSFAAPPIVVNIPEYRLRAIDAAGGRRLSMKVVVGRAYRHRTPVFAAEMTHVLFRPFWNVPLGIQRDELLPRIERDPRFLERERYEIVDPYGNAAGVEPTAEALECLRAGSLRIRQRPGPHNALGLVKFVFPNEHDVYLHGTPSQELFARPRRDFSHGCIRVEDPVALAEWVLRDQPAWSADAIRAAMNGPQTRRVELVRPIPVLIVYGTAVVSEDGEVQFLDDVYGHDAALERALAERHPYSD